MKKEKYDEIEKFKKEDVRFRLIIFGLLKTANEAYISGDVDAYKKAVFSLEQNLSHYAPKDYLEEAKTIKAIPYMTEDSLKEILKKKGKDFSELYDYEVTRRLFKLNDSIDLYKYGKLYRLLIKVCHERNLLLDIEIDTDAKGQEDMDENMDEGMDL